MHKRQRKFFTLFAKRPQHIRNVAKFEPKKQIVSKSFSIPKVSFRLDFVKTLIRQSEVTFIISTSLVIFFILIFLHYFFMISKVEIKDNNGLPLQSWNMEGIEKVYGENILLFSTESIEHSIRLSNPSIRSIQVKKSYPQTVELLVRLQEPVGYFTYSNTRYFLLSADGTLLNFAYERPDDMGEILYYQSVSPGEYTLGKPMGSRDIRFASQIAGVLRKYGFSKFTITIQDSHLITAEVDDFSIKAASDSDNPNQLSSLDQLLRIVQKGGEKIKSVDVRFDKIIIEK